MAEFFHMGGHAYFIWMSYAIVCITFVYAFFSPIYRHRKLLRDLSKTNHGGKTKKVIATLKSADDEFSQSS